MKHQRAASPSKKRIRNLVQYRDLTDEEFDAAYEADFLQSASESLTSEELEEQIQNKLDALSEDYDMSDMKVNDRQQIRALILAEIQLEELEQAVYQLRKDISPDTILIIEKVNGIMSRLRADISNISEDLQLTRSIRKNSQETSVINYLDELKEKARKFYKEKMLYIFCTECKNLLATIWLHYPDNDINEIELKCEKCNKITKVKTHQLYNTKNKNTVDVMVP